MNEQASLRKRGRVSSELGMTTLHANIHSTVNTILPGPGAPHRQRLSVFLSATLLERLRNAVYWNNRRPLAQIIAAAIEEAVTNLEQANGGVFPPRLAPLKPGRPRRARLSTPAPST